MRIRSNAVWCSVVAVFILLSSQCMAQGPAMIVGNWNQGAWLGVSISDLTQAKAAELKLPDENGVLIDHVDKASPAEKAGLEANDVITQFNGIKVLTTRQLTRMISELLPDRVVQLGIWREGASKSISVKLGQPPKPESSLQIWRNGEAPYTFNPHNLDMEPLRKNLQGLSENFSRLYGPMGLEMFKLNGPRLGVTIDSLTPQLGDYFGVKEGHGALITSVEKESPAEKAGLKAGDVIVNIDSKEVDSPGDVIRMIREKQDGRLEIKVLRDRQPKSFSVQIEKPALTSPTFAHRVRQRRVLRSSASVI